MEAIACAEESVMWERDLTSFSIRRSAARERKETYRVGEDLSTRGRNQWFPPFWSPFGVKRWLSW